MYCLNCGSLNKLSAKVCADCGKSFEEVVSKLDINIKKDVPATPKSFGTVLGDRFDFSLFESMAADIEREMSGGEDDKDLGRWGGKTIDGLELFKDIISKQNK